MKNIVFVDIDGVARPATIPNNYKPDTECVKWINRALDLLDAEVVISSNWRLAYPLSFFQSLFSDRVIGFTEDHGGSFFGEYLRWHEVKAFCSVELKVEKRCWIFDDRADLFPPAARNLILCDPLKGFCEADFLKVKDLLAQ